MKKLFYILPALVLLVACSKPTDKKTQLADLKKQAADINAQIIKLQGELGSTDSVKSTDVAELTLKSTSFTSYVDLQGSVDAKDNVIANPQAQGVITAIYIKAGDHVNAGQTLVQLDNSVLKQQIAQAETQANLAKMLFDRQKNLWDQKIGTEVQFLQAQTNLQSAQKQVAALRQQADLYRIVSPISGTVDQMDLKLGQAAAPGATAIRILNTDFLKIKANVPESYADRVHQGDQVQVMIPDANDSLTAKITFAARAIDAASRSFPIEIQLAGSNRLKPNMTAVLKIADYSKSNALVVPINAIQKSESGDFVFVDENGYAKKRVIVQGTSYGGKAEIKSGLKPGDKLVTDGASEIEDGDKLKVLQVIN